MAARQAFRKIESRNWIAQVHEVGVLSQQAVGLGRTVGCARLISCDHGRVEGGVVAQTAARVVAGHADCAPSHVKSLEPGNEGRRIPADANGRVRVAAARGSNVVGIMAGRAGLWVNFIRGPGHGDVVQGIPGLVALQYRQPGQEAVSRMAARTAAAFAFVDGHLVVGMLAQLPLLKACMAQWFTVADRADVGGDVAPGVKTCQT